MKRLALAVAALAALASLSSCSDDSGSDDSGSDAAAPSASKSASDEPTDATQDATDDATEEATDAATEDAGSADPARFTIALTQASELFTRLNAEDDGSQPDPTSAEEANAAAGLDETTDLVFVDFTPLPEGDGGSYCLASATTGTYVAASIGGAAGELDLGDGECSYDTAAAVVVGDLDADTWTTGGELMGDLTPSAVFGG
jgi:hypothetical protein